MANPKYQWPLNKQHAVAYVWQRQWALIALIFCMLVAGPASAQELTATFYPQKPVYLSGEPVWFVFEVTNKGHAPVYIEDANPYGVCAFASDYSFEVPGAAMTNIWRCGYIADCVGGGLKLLGPGATYRQRLLLNQWFQIDHPGTYHVIASRNLRFSLHRGKYSFIAPESRSFRRDFEIRVAKGNNAAVEKAFEPFLKNLNSHGFKQRTEAIEAITTMAPPYLEKTIIALAESNHSFTQSRAIPALAKLNTAASRRVLARLIEDRQSDYSWQAINALAGTHDAKYAPLLEKLARDPAWQRAAIPALGELGGAKVIWFLAPLVYYPLGFPNEPPLQQLAIRGLANTGSRKAIPYLIRALRDPLVHQDAVNGLEQLTHLVIFQKNSRHWLYTKDRKTADQMAERWQHWWTSQGKQAKIYGPHDCTSPPEPLP